MRDTDWKDQHTHLMHHLGENLIQNRRYLEMMATPTHLDLVVDVDLRLRLFRPSSLLENQTRSAEKQGDVEVKSQEEENITQGARKKEGKRLEEQKVISQKKEIEAQVDTQREKQGNQEDEKFKKETQGVRKKEGKRLEEQKVISQKKQIEVQVDTQREKQVNQEDRKVTRLKETKVTCQEHLYLASTQMQRFGCQEAGGNSQQEMVYVGHG
ncbi:MAG: hypothetical protein MJE68_22345, partial [Proteobacteria bacterium]|nr:hypothetical protein [Pseudomonadota bacterium]